MNRHLSPKISGIAVLCALFVMLWVSAARAAAPQQVTGRPGERRSSSGGLRANALLTFGNDPFTALAEEEAAGKSFIINFRRTEFDTKAEATARVALRGQTLLVRMRARNLPLPTHFEVPRYALWVYLANYRVKMYIGDLPVTQTGSPNHDDITRRGEADSAYEFPCLPPGAIFGGLLLTAEPARYTPVINQALRPLLISLTSDMNIEDADVTAAPGEAPLTAPKQ